MLAHCKKKLQNEQLIVDFKFLISVKNCYLLEYNALHLDENQLILPKNTASNKSSSN
jgi:hypothetical protein